MPWCKVSIIHYDLRQLTIRRTLKFGVVWIIPHIRKCISQAWHGTIWHVLCSYSNITLLLGKAKVAPLFSAEDFKYRAFFLPVYKGKELHVTLKDKSNWGDSSLSRRFLAMVYCICLSVPWYIRSVPTRQHSARAGWYTRKWKLYDFGSVKAVEADRTDNGAASPFG